MRSKAIVIPLYCPNCDNLIYIAKQIGHKAQLIQFYKGDWLEHPCALINNGIIWQEPVITEREKLKWGLDRLPFSPRTGQRSLRSNNASFGVVSSIYEMENFCNLRVFTNDQVLIDVKVRETRSNLSAGMLLDLSGLTRVGKGKYRLPEIEEINLPNPVLPISTVPDIYVELTIKSKDQGLLETFTRRFLQFFLEKGTSAFLVSVLPLLSLDRGIQYSRVIYFRPVTSLMESLKDISIPDTVDLSIQEIKSASPPLTKVKET